MRGVTLLTWRSAIGFEDGLDEWSQRSHHRSHSLNQLTLGRFSARQRLSHHPPMNSKFGRDSLDASDSELVLPADSLEQLHLRSPLHPPASCSSSRMLQFKEGGPIYSIEVGRFTISKSHVRWRQPRRAVHTLNRREDWRPGP